MCTSIERITPLAPGSADFGTPSPVAESPVGPPVPPHSGAGRGPAGPTAGRLESGAGPPPSRGADPARASAFAAALADEERRALRWSSHAGRRVEERGIALDAERLERLKRAVVVAGARGARSSVVWLDQVAYVVDISTGTVLTAVTRSPGKEAVFTNIDSVVIA